MIKLTNREAQVLKYLIKGFSNKDIANILCISKDTVKIYLKQIYTKLNATNRVSAAVKAISANLVDLEEVNDFQN